ncbi:MAG: beta-ketoacyl-ACP synthase III [Pseudomonadales bacterium]
MSDVYITHLSAFMPNDPVHNDDMEDVLGMVGTKPSRARRLILRSNGIQERYYAIDPVTGNTTHTNAQLTGAAVRELVDAEFELRDMQALACGTSIADQLMPGHGVMVHGELGSPPCEVVSMAGVCVAGVSAMKYAYMSVASGDSEVALATGSETASAVMRGNKFASELAVNAQDLERVPEIAFEKDFLRWMLSDGAGAMVLQSQPRHNGLSLRIEWIMVRSYANEMDACMYSGAEKQADGQLKGWAQYEPEEWLQQSVFSVKQDVKQLNEHVIHYTVERPLQELVVSKGLRPDDIDHFLPHYSSKYFRERVYEGMQRADFEIPYDRWFSNLTVKGNTGSASIYIMLEDLYRSGDLQAGQKLLCYVPESGRFSTAFILLTVC